MEHTRPQRKSPRLRAHDYAQAGIYFVTICTNERIDWFGQIVEDEMRLNELGQVADAELQAIPDHYKTVQLDLSVVMPNHIHAIITLVGTP
jgi:REP element-mobilizing transposase RayT